MIYNMVSQGGATPTGTKTINITANGTTTEDVTNYANAQVVANVPNTYSAGDEGKVVSSGALVSQTTLNVTTNGTYDTTTNNSTVVAVPASAVDTGTKNITANGNNQDVVGYAAVNVNVPNSYTAGDEGKVVDNGALVSQTAVTYTANGTYNTTTHNSVTVLVDDAPTLQNKSVSYTPTESAQSATVSPDVGYDGLSSVGVTVGAISSTYVGSAIDRRDDTDLSASGATVTVPSGYYEDTETYTIASGSATTPSTTITANPTISVSSGGLITATTSASQSVTPTVSPGYVSSGTSGTVSVSGSKTQQLTTQGATTITPTTSSQTAVAANTYTTGAITVAAMPSGTAGTPVATKSAVNNHSLTVTPSVTNTTGYITGSTLTGTPVTVTVAELESGTKTITSNGNGIDVSGYSTVDVNVSGGGSGIVTIVDTLDACGGTIRTITTNEISLDTLNVTADGTYNAPSGHAYNTVNVSVGGGSNMIDMNYIKQLGSWGMRYADLPDTCYFGNLTSMGDRAFGNCTGGRIIVLPSISTVGQYSMADSPEYEIIDLGPNMPNIVTNYFFSEDLLLDTLIIRKSSVVSINNVNEFNLTKFDSGGTGGTLYVPSALISSYQSASNWSTVLAYANNSIEAIEGSYYETHYADGTLIS